MMSDEKTARKQEKDFTPEVVALVPEVTKLVAQEGQLQTALDKIAVLEKQTRNASDLKSTSTLLVLAIQLCYEPTPNYELLNSQLVAYSKKHGQLKEAVTRMVVKGMDILDSIAKGKSEDDARSSHEWLVEAIKAREAERTQGSGEDGMAGKTLKTWLELLNTLRDITEGKIYLELQRARLTKKLADYHEMMALHVAPSTSSGPSASSSSSSAPAPASTSAPATTSRPLTLEVDDEEKPKRPDPVTSQDHLSAAADLMSEIQVETYSSMDKREKTEFILEQMRLESERDQWNKVRVGSRKVNRAYLRESGNSDMKLIYWKMMVDLALHEDEYLEACKAWQEIWDTESVKADETRSKEVIEQIIIFIVLAPYDNEQNDMLHKLYANHELQTCVLHYALLKSFITKELMRWPGIESIYGPTLRQSSVFASSSPSTSGSLNVGDKRWKALHDRVIEHNIRVIAMYYTQATLTRLAELLDLTPDVAERTLSKLVVDKVVYAKIDRPAGIVDFAKRKNADEVLNEWSGDLDKMLSLIEKTSHLINKEYALHAAQAVATTAS